MKKALEIEKMPVDAREGLKDKLKSFTYSAHFDETGTRPGGSPVFQICDTATVLRRKPYEQLNDLMKEMLPDTVCLDIEDSSRSRPSDDQVWQMIIEMAGVTNSSAFQVLEDKSKRMVLKELKDKGASYRQLERLTGVGRGLIQKL